MNRDAAAAAGNLHYQRGGFAAGAPGPPWSRRWCMAQERVHVLSRAGAAIVPLTNTEQPGFRLTLLTES
ncbi:MAG: hypothetical protein AVDCRST_MAG49-3623 [uncultured Thermomicrobiales bacterium]|uniref:Uncharacterized protein n=1 Tax=uncultured Thermomicrobiales bacterium TaxID=1645740 RepID=A0A6J4VDK5_9BACT|nr:MAG: hypothetical protein AVDCRST_MAG49-3623 [uncultured Thermomicrobiales bacterium]